RQGSPRFCRAGRPMWWTSHSVAPPLASMARRVASTISGPVPSPGMRVRRWVNQYLPLQVGSLLRLYDVVARRDLELLQRLSYAFGRRAERGEHLHGDPVALRDEAEQKRLGREAMSARVAEPARIADDLLRARRERDRVRRPLPRRYDLRDLRFRLVVIDA